MKNLILSLVTLISVTSQARPQANAKAVQIYQAIGVSQVHPNHVQTPQSALIQINYLTNTVSLEIERNVPCPANKMCAMMYLPPFTVELPIVSIQQSYCGISEVTARIDDRPVDGILAEIKIDDISATTCQFFAELLSNATYTTQYADRLKGINVVEQSKLSLRLIEAHDE